MIQSIAAFSKEKDSYVAGKEAAEEAVDLLDGAPDLIIVFASSLHDHEKVLSGVDQHAGWAKIVGCSDAGEIVAEEEQVYKGAVVVMALRMDGVEVNTSRVGGAGNDSYKAGKKLGENIQKKQEKPSLLLIFGEGLIENGSAAVEGIKGALGKDTPIVGGLAGDDFNFEKTYQYHNGKSFSGSLVGVALSGDFSFGTGCGHGWKPVTLPMKVTKSKGPLLQEIDNKPALSVYEDYFGKHCEELSRGILAKTIYTYPLGVFSKEGVLLRELLKANKKGEIELMVDIKKDSEVRLMVGSRREAVSSAREAAKSAMKGIKKPKAALMFNCIGRSKLLGFDREKEIDAVREVIGKKTPLIGFYTYGEVGPFSKKGDESVFHNETISMLVLGE